VRLLTITAHAVIAQAVSILGALDALIEETLFLLFDCTVIEEAAVALRDATHANQAFVLAKAMIRITVAVALILAMLEAPMRKQASFVRRAIVIALAFITTPGARITIVCLAEAIVVSRA